MSKKIILPVALFALSQSTFAAELPSAGGQVQQIPPAPTPQSAAPPLQIEQGVPAIMSASDNVKIVVNALRVTGQTLYSEAELIAITGFRPGELTLSELRAMASKIADYYHRQGYFVAQAYLPRRTSRTKP